MEISIPLPNLSPVQWFMCCYVIFTAIWMVGLAIFERSGGNAVIDPLLHILFWPLIVAYYFLCIIAIPYCLIASRPMPWDYEKEIKFHVYSRKKVTDALNSYVKTLSRKPVDKVSIRYAACYPEITVTAYKRQMCEITQIVEQCNACKDY